MNKVLLIDDHNLIYMGFAGQFSGEVELHYASNIQEAKDIIYNKSIDIAVIDISIGKENGFDLAQDVRNHVSTIFFLTMHKSQIYIQKAVSEGFNGYFLKDEPLDLMQKAFLNPNARKFWMTEQVAAVLENATVSKTELYDQLSPREQQVLRLIAEGVGYREIAGKLNISAKTVNVHRANIMRKINVDNQIDMVKYALKIGIVGFD